MFSFANRRIKRAVAEFAAIAVLATGGIGLSFLSRQVEKAQLAEGLQQDAPYESGSRDELSRQLALFSLGGLRSLAAEILAVDATSAWVEQDWPRADRRWKEITTLAPRRVNYWVRAARDMSKNAVSHARRLKTLSERDRVLLAARYRKRGEEYLQDGIACNPKSALLHLELAAYYEDPMGSPNFRKASSEYEKALALGAPDMYRRWVFYNMARTRGREQEAWQMGRLLFREKQHRSISLRCILFALQNKLDLPEGEKLSVEELFGSDSSARKQLSLYRGNNLHYPTYGVEQFLKKIEKR